MYKEKQFYAVYTCTSIVLQFSREVTFQAFTTENDLTADYYIHVNKRTAKFSGDKQVTKFYNTAGS